MLGSYDRESIGSDRPWRPYGDSSGSCWDSLPVHQPIESLIDNYLVGNALDHMVDGRS